MAERGLNISKLSNDTHISRNTLSALYHNTGKGIQYDTLDNLCSYFDVSVERLLTHIDVSLQITNVEWIEEDLELEMNANLYIYDQPIPCRLEVTIINKSTFKDGNEEFLSIDLDINLNREALHFPTVLPEEQLASLIFPKVFDKLLDTYNNLVTLSLKVNQKFI